MKSLLGSNRGLRLKPVSDGPSRVDERVYGKLGFLGNREVAARDEAAIYMWLNGFSYDEYADVSAYKRAQYEYPYGRTREAKRYFDQTRSCETIESLFCVLHFFFKCLYILYLVVLIIHVIRYHDVYLNFCNGINIT